MRITEHALRSDQPGKCAACKKDTNWYCEDCHRGFCPECFDRFHRPNLDPMPQWRREPRTLAQGEIRIQTADGTVLLGRLLDSSPHGFRIVLKAGGFTVGEEVRLRYRWDEVLVRVVWKKEIEGIIEAGLHISER